MNSATPSPSSGYNFIDAVKKPIVYACFVTIPLVVITSLLNLCVLCRRTLRSSACTIYFLAAVPPILLNVIVTPLNILLTNNYNIFLNSTPITCPLVQFLIYTTTLLFVSMLLCASIDRFLSSSTSVRLRRLSSVRIARRVIIMVWVVVLTYMSPFLAIYHYEPVASKCAQYATTLTAIFLISRVVLHYLIIPILLGIFGILTIRNIRSHTRRVMAFNQKIIHRRTEGQIGRMLIIQVVAYFLFFTPSGITYVLLTFVSSMNTSYYITFRSLTIVWQQGGSFMSFFFYVLTGKIYRDELKKMFKCNQIRNQIPQLDIPLYRRTDLNNTV